MQTVTYVNRYFLPYPCSFALTPPAVNSNDDITLTMVRE